MVREGLLTWEIQEEFLDPACFRHLGSYGLRLMT